ncbi:hypothetical protein LSTR_LSTR011822 [Laodelphax striatellus]|uniref:Uncharacterized protein n=1 Tax=Laodelphax striatellus TaxID=195883 RepID=A0A482WIN9_LAOST|nr:hypothetical protein LSTR_LSTR011822 [Laodelphax striatellus]
MAKLGSYTKQNAKYETFRNDMATLNIAQSKFTRGTTLPTTQINMYKLAILFLALIAMVYAAPSYLLPAPLAYHAAPYAIPAPYSYSSGYHIVRSVEPVEQHGYKIVY